MARPTRKDEAVHEAFIEEMIPELLDWGGGSLHEDDIRDNLIKLFKYRSTHDDGYKLARELENINYRWDPDTELVEILDCARATEARALGTATREWVEKEGIKPAHSVGDLVIHDYHKRGEMQFEITKINFEKAEYQLTSEALGHIKEKEGDKRDGTLGFIVPFEAVDTVEERVGTTPLFEKGKHG